MNGVPDFGAQSCICRLLIPWAAFNDISCRAEGWEPSQHSKQDLTMPVVSFTGSANSRKSGSRNNVSAFCGARLMHALLTILVIVSTLMLSCLPRGNFELVPEVPIGKPPDGAFQPIPSIVNVPIEMKTEVIQRIINGQLDSLLFESDTMTVAGRKPVKVRVWKKDTIGISLAGDELHYRLPLHIWMQFSFTVGALGLQHTEYQDVEAEIVLNFSSRLFVKNDWRIVTMTRPEGYEWLSEPVVKIRFLTIPVTPVVDFILGRQKDTFGSQLDSALGQLIDLKKMIHPLWMRVQEPMMISQWPPVWLRLTPLGVYMTQLEGREGVIRGSIGIRTVAETFIGDRPDAHVSDSLPEFVIPGAIDSAFVLNLYCEMTWEHATDLARSYLRGRRFRSGLKEVIVQDVSLMGIDGYPVVQLDFTGKLSGEDFRDRRSALRQRKT
jgi:hypothetical protein